MLRYAKYSAAERGIARRGKNEEGPPMATFYTEPSRTFSEYLLIPGYTGEGCIPANVSLRTPLVKYRRGEEEPAISLNIPLTSAIMQSVSDDRIATCGTINMDYRSLYHHFEMGTLMHGFKAIDDMKQDFDDLFGQCEEITEKYRNMSTIKRIAQLILRLISPLA